MFYDRTWDSIESKKNSCHMDVKILDLMQKSFHWSWGPVVWNRNGIGNMISMLRRHHSNRCFSDWSLYEIIKPSFGFSGWFSLDVVLNRLRWQNPSWPKEPREWFVSKKKLYWWDHTFCLCICELTNYHRHYIFFVILLT